MNIEILRIEDIEKYKELIDNCFESSNEIESYKKNYNTNYNYEIIVAKIDDKIVGSVTMYKINLFTFSFQPALELFNVAVHSEYRGKNIATKLLDYVIKYAKNNNYKSIYLNCLNSAVNAHKLYEKMGFKKADSYKYSLYLSE